MDILNSKELVEKLINENKMALVYFGSKTCGVCTDLKPKVEDILKKYPKIKSAYIDVEKFHKIAVSYGFFTIPGILLFVEGKESIREARHISVQDIDNRISRYCSLLFE